MLYNRLLVREVVSTIQAWSKLETVLSGRELDTVVIGRWALTNDPS